MKPNPCGYYGDSKRECRCSNRQIETYRQKISGPLLDRIDIHCEVPLVDFRELSSNTNTGESSAVIRQRVIAARSIQLERFKESSNTTNSSMGSQQVRQHCQFSSEGNGYLEHAMEEMNLSARAYDRILNLAPRCGGGVFADDFQTTKAESPTALGSNFSLGYPRSQGKTLDPGSSGI